MRAEQGPHLWGCDPECGPGADTMRLELTQWLEGAE